jgi:DNA-binding MarR family transcriptional regulator/GNAT superfamily N-acetyltransferase
MSDSHIADIRAFNRFYTRQLGLLNEHVARSAFSLAEGRVLYEISRHGHTTGIELAQLLGVDPAYISRILQALLRRGLLASSPIPSDRRRNSIALTKEGDAEVEKLERLNSTAVQALVSQVDAEDLDALVASMKTIQLILGDEPPPPAPIILRNPRVGDLGWLTYRNGVLYNQQFGWNGDFEALVAGIYQEFHELPEAPSKQLWIAERNGKILGSVFVIPYRGSAETAQLRMLYVEPEARGLGIGTLLVKQAVDFSRGHGYRSIRLWTQESLTSARKIYAAAGFKMLSAEPHESFGKALTGEYWELDLSKALAQ